MTATIHDVAKRAGVSISTVSNVINERSGRMRAETHRRVLDAIAELGYEPRAAARQLKTGESRIIGLIVPSVANPFWGMLAREVENEALSFGYQVLLCNAERNPVRERHYAELLLASGVRGVIFGSSPRSMDHLSGLAKRGLLVMAFDRPRTQNYEEGVTGSIGVDNELGGRLAVQHLLDLGHRRIGFISGPIRTVSRQDRLKGHNDALIEAGIEPDPDLVWEGSMVSAYGDIEGAELGRLGVREMLLRPNPPTAICAVNDMYALGASAGVRELGLTVPNDISIVGFDDIAMASVAQPPLTTVRQPVAEMMQVAVSTLIGRLQGVSTGEPEHITAAPELVVRSSTAALSSSPLATELTGASRD